MALAGGRLPRGRIEDELEIKMLAGTEPRRAGVQAQVIDGYGGYFCEVTSMV